MERRIASTGMTENRTHVSMTERMSVRYEASVAVVGNILATALQSNIRSFQYSLYINQHRFTESGRKSVHSWSEINESRDNMKIYQEVKLILI